MKDDNGVLLGIVTSLGGYGVEIYTSTGHQVFLDWDGTIYPSQIYYTGGGCTGSAYLNSGGSTAGATWGKQVVYSGSLASLMVLTGADANGLVANTSFTRTGFDNPTCGVSSGTSYGYPLATTTAAAVGLPSYPVVAPLLVVSS